MIHVWNCVKCVDFRIVGIRLRVLITVSEFSTPSNGAFVQIYVEVVWVVAWEVQALILVEFAKGRQRDPSLPNINSSSQREAGIFPASSIT